MERLKRGAKRNANISFNGTGRLARSIDWRIRKGSRFGQGGILRGAVFSNVIYDKVQSEGIPARALTGNEAKSRSRKWRGRNHRLKSGQRYDTSKGTKRGWAFGRRKKTKFMTRHQNLEEINRQIAEDVARDIMNQFVKSLKGFA